MAWIRDGAPPEQVKVTFLVSAKEHPELAQFILSLPYGRTSKILRAILSSAVRNAGATQVVMNHPAGQTAAPLGEPVAQDGHQVANESRANQDSPPGVDDVSAAAASIIHNFDRMFPL